MALPSRRQPADDGRASWLALPGCAAFVALCNALIAFFGDHHSSFPRELSLVERTRLFLFLMTGPFGSWAMASHVPHPSVVHILVSLSAATLAVLLIRRFTTSLASLLGAALGWVFCGYLVCIAVWI